MTDEVVRAAIYCRISEDRAGAGLGVARQREDCERLAAELGWTVDPGAVFSDNDVSAYKARPRKDYLRMLAALRDGEYDAVLAWHTDRLHRSPVELEEFIAVCEERSLKVRTVQAGAIDLSNASGRAVARTLGAWARFESEHKADRIRRKAAECAAAGKPSGGGGRPFGYEPGLTAIREDEAAVIRDLVRRFLAGESLTSLTRALNESGLRPTGGAAKWGMTTVRSILRSARISGRREHHGRIVATATWPAIISPADSDRVRAMLADPARRNTRCARRYVLSGLVRCECGASMVSHPRKGVRRYVCKTEAGGCGHRSINAEDVEALVTEGVLYRLDSPELAATLAGRAAAVDADSAALAEADAADEAQLAELADLYGRRQITAGEWLAARRPVEARLAQSRRRRLNQADASALDGWIGNASALRDAWPTLPIDRTRAIVAAVLTHATIHPGTGTTRFDPQRVEPIWRL